jgi:hypothetical protein
VIALYPAGGMVSTTGVGCSPEELAIAKGEQAFIIRMERSMLITIDTKGRILSLYI